MKNDSFCFTFGDPRACSVAVVGANEKQAICLAILHIDFTSTWRMSPLVMVKIIY